MNTTKDDRQDPIKETYGDYCDACIKSGDALKDLIEGLTTKVKE